LHFLRHIPETKSKQKLVKTINFVSKKFVDGCHDQNHACNPKAAPFNVNNFQEGELILWRDECPLGNLLVGRFARTPFKTQLTISRTTA
jgi:hypothetical protein